MNEYQWMFTSIFLSCKCAMFFFPRLIVSISLYTCIIILFDIVFIFDTGKELWVWIGRGSTRAESKNAMPRAHVRITTPPHIHAHTHTH